MNIIPKVVLGPPKKKSDLGTFAQVILALVTGNPHFLTPNPSVVVLTAAIALFFTTQTSARTKVVGAAAAHRDAYSALLALLQHLRDYVQSIVEASPTNALSVIEGSGLKVRKQSSRTKPQLAAKAGALSTTVDLIAKALAGDAVYYWEYSLNQKTWTCAGEDFKASMLISGLTPGQTYYFRFRGLTRKGKTDYSQVVSLIAK